MDWSGCDLVESIPDKVSGADVLVGTRIPVEAITENFDAFMDVDHLPIEASIEAVADCFPGAGRGRIKALLDYRNARDYQLQP